MPNPSLHGPFEENRIVDDSVNNGQPLGHNLVWKSDDKEHWKECDRAGCEEAEKHTQFDKTTHVISYHEVDEQYHSLECECGRSFANEKHDGLADDGSCSKCQNGIKTFTAGATGTDSLNEALTAVAASGGTITLNKDYRGDGAEFKPSTTQEITIDANGNTLTLTTALSIETTGTVKLAGNIIAQQGITISGSGEVVLNGATVTGNVSISEGTLTLKGATITGNITLTVGSAEVYFEDDGSNTITGTVTINTTPENAESLFATFEQEQTAYKLKVEGVTCDELSGSVAFGEKSTPIRHTYSDQNNGKHKCAICEDEQAHTMSVVAGSYNKETDEHTLKCNDCDHTETSTEHTYDQADGSCACGATKAVAALKTLTIDFTASIEGIGKSSSDKTTGTFTLDSITYNCSNLYQAKNGNSYYLMLYGKNSFVANDTEWSGAITKITATVRSGASSSAAYALKLSTSKLSSALSSTSESNKVTYTGGGEHNIVITAEQSSNFTYFNLTQTSSKNGQITKIVIEYYA